MSSWRGAGFVLGSAALTLVLAHPLHAQDSAGSGFESIEIPEQRLPLCFGFRDITDPKALAVCDALNLRENVRARELAQSWVQQEPGNPAAQFALAEILFTVEGNMARALYHLNQAEALTGYDSLETALGSGNLQWHYLTLSQLSYVHQLMGNQLESLAYLDKIGEVYGQDVESFRGWPLIKLKEYEAARASANRVLESSDDPRTRARAWNTLCAVELASLAPLETTSACDEAINEGGNQFDTVYLSNAAEVALSLLQIDQAESYLDRATRYLNPDSVADPWIYKLYLTMNQGRFDDARAALDRMLIWREQQEPVVSVMNRAEHFMVSAAFLLLAGYAEDAAKLTATALNQPDRNGSYSADDAQKDAYAALLNTMANETLYQQRLEQLSSASWLERVGAQWELAQLRLRAWQASRRAAALFAEFDTLQNRLRAYAPLDVHIPEWMEPELVELMGSGVLRETLDQARANGAFQLNEGYYYAYLAEIAALDSDNAQTLAAGTRALAQLPQQEVLLRARLDAHMAAAAWDSDQQTQALAHYAQALRQDPSVLRRLGAAIPVALSTDGATLSEEIESYLKRSPRFKTDTRGLPVAISNRGGLRLCLQTADLEDLACYTPQLLDSESDLTLAQQAVQGFHQQVFGLGYDISKAQRSMLLGSSVILSSQNNSNLQRSRDAFLKP